MISAVVLRAQPDATLASLAGAGSELAFEALVKRYRRLLVSYCRRLLLSESRSEDVVQQAFLNAWTALKRGTEVRDVKAWLYRITHNEALSALRRPGYDFDELKESIRGTGAPESDLDRRMVMREALAAVAALPELQREAILRTAVDGSSYEEVAEALGISDDSVRGLVYRARASLRSGLAVLAPTPVVAWAAGRRGGESQWLSEALAGGGSAGGAAVVVKGAAVLATSAAIVGGTVTGTLSHLIDSSHSSTAATVPSRSDQTEQGRASLSTGLGSASAAVTGRVTAANYLPAARQSTSSSTGRVQFEGSDGRSQERFASGSVVGSGGSGSGSGGYGGDGGGPRGSSGQGGGGPGGSGSGGGDGGSPGNGAGYGGGSSPSQGGGSPGGGSPGSSGHGTQQGPPPSGESEQQMGGQPGGSLSGGLISTSSGSPPPGSGGGGGSGH